ncbi:hypothetical protein [Roseivirga pacifica]|uniref:hypothetical protein n=1 Tax=Roseivirga pacifica TaxID=1267423 RepID=UPI003BAF4E92
MNTLILTQRKARNIALLLVLVALFLMGFLTSCKDDDGPLTPSARELAFEKLSGDWDLGNGAGRIEVDGTDVSANYPGFTLSFTDGGYTTTNGADLFNASGTWQWTDEDAKMLSLDDGKEVTITLLNENRFTFTFTHAGGSSANGINTSNGIEGSYTISVVK